jgi:hypothetical protein
VMGNTFDIRKQSNMSQCTVDKNIAIFRMETLRCLLISGVVLYKLDKLRPYLEQIGILSRLDSISSLQVHSCVSIFLRCLRGK